MRAAIYEQYGSPEVVHLCEVPTPTPKDDELLIQIHATTVTTGDWRVRSMRLPRGFGAIGRLVLGITRPRQPILGTEFSGVVTAVGKDVRTFAVGDAVFAFTGAKMGCHAEYRTVPADGLVVRMPASLSFTQAAALSFGGTTALDFFRRGKLQRGETILINGASGGVGSAAVQLAAQLGAHVTGVSSTAHVELVRSLGAEHVIDYTQEDFTTQGRRYDVIMDIAGTAPFTRCQGSLTERGRFLQVLGGLSDLLTAPVAGLLSGKKIVAGPVSERLEDLQQIAALAASGAYTPVIDQIFPFEHIVDAHRRVDSGHKQGSVVVTVR